MNKEWKDVLTALKNFKNLVVAYGEMRTTINSVNGARERLDDALNAFKKAAVRKSKKK